MRIEDIMRVLHEVITRDHGDALRAFLQANPAPNWVVASDYVIGAKDRPRDAFCYTLYPLDDDIRRLLAEAGSQIPADLKKTPLLNPNLIESLRSMSRFSFCFVRQSDEQLFRDVQDVRESTRLSIELMQTRPGWEVQLAALKRLRQKAQANSFNVSLFSDTVLVSLFAAMVATCVVESAKPKTVTWCSDRDKMTTAFDKFAYIMMGIHFGHACHEFGVDAEGVILGTGDMTNQVWFDELIRIPDFLAGALSAFDPSSRMVSTAKHLSLLTEVVSDATNIAIFEVEARRNRFACHTLILAKGNEDRSSLAP